MRRNKQNIIYAWVLLLFFATGQYMVFAHQHYKLGSAIAASKAGVTVLKEKCDICDAMHHTTMLVTQYIYFIPAVAVAFHYQYKKADLKLIQLILASGRAPPIS